MGSQSAVNTAGGLALYIFLLKQDKSKDHSAAERSFTADYPAALIFKKKTPVHLSSDKDLTYNSTSISFFFFGPSWIFPWLHSSVVPKLRVYPQKWSQDF